MLCLFTGNSFPFGYINFKINFNFFRTLSAKRSAIREQLKTDRPHDVYHKLITENNIVETRRDSRFFQNIKAADRCAQKKTSSTATFHNLVYEVQSVLSNTFNCNRPIEIEVKVMQNLPFGVALLLGNKMFEMNAADILDVVNVNIIENGRRTKPRREISN